MRKAAVLLFIMTLAVSRAGGASSKSNDNLFVYLSPRPGAEYVSPNSTLIFRPGEPLEAEHFPWRSSVIVEGSISGVHEGSWTIADDSETAVFKPHHGFELGEIVTVKVTEGGAEIHAHSFSIKSRIADYRPDEGRPERSACPRPAAAGGGGRLKCHPPGPDPERFTLPRDLPVPDITVLDDPGRGKIFAANIPAPNDSTPSYYMMILENDGFPAFFRRMPVQVWDFKKQPNGLLSFMQNDYFYTMDDAYTVIDSFTSVNMYPINNHDFHILPNGHVVFICDDPQVIDMSRMVEHGDPDAKVVGNVVQELDQSKNLVFQWRTVDFFNILDTKTDLTASTIRYADINSVDYDAEGNILISCGYQNEVTKISRLTGEIIWRFGGMNNQFTLEGDTLWFTGQNDVRRLPNGNITIYDNGDPDDPEGSRAVEYMLDEESLVATQVWEYRNAPPVHAEEMGNVQRLPGGNTVIGWGSSGPIMTEVQGDGTKAFEMFLSGGCTAYRSFRFPWEGNAGAPFAWADTTGEMLVMNFMKFGDGDVRNYRVYREVSATADTMLVLTPDSYYRIRGFEAGVPLYLMVTAVDRYGNESPFSNMVTVVPEFSDTLEVVRASVRICPRALNVESQGRWITATIGFPCGSGHNIYDIDRSSILLNGEVSPEWTCKYGIRCYRRMMAKFPRDEVIAILPGGDRVEIRISGRVGEFLFEGIDTINVVRCDTCDTGPGPEPGGGPLEPERFAGPRNFPNPFNPSTVISFSLPGPTRINLSVYDVRGRLVATLADGLFGAGAQEIAWDGTNEQGRAVASGVYFYRLRMPGEVITRKMVLLR